MKTRLIKAEAQINENGIIKTRFMYARAKTHREATNQFIKELNGLDVSSLTVFFKSEV